MVHTQFALKIKAIRIDNDKEFDMPDFLSSNGIIHQHSCVYTTQKNSAVEKKHQHLLSIARALQNQSHLPIQLWSEYVLKAAYLINRLPSPLLNNKTPFDLLLKGHQIIVISRCFAVCVLLPPLLKPEISSLQELEGVLSLVIHSM